MSVMSILTGPTARERQALLQRLADEQGRSGPSPSGIPRRDPGVAVPLSFAQEALWFLDRLTPGDATYNVAYLIGVPGLVPVDLVRRSLDAVFARHEILRTTFAEGPDGPVQVVAPERRWDPLVVDLRRLEASRWEELILSSVKEESCFAFDLEAGPLTRHTLFRLADDKHVLLSAMHHIVCDTWSVGLFDAEFRRHLHAFSRAEAPAVPALPFQFGDWAAWQRQRLEAGLDQGDLDYWRAQLEGLRPLRLPYDRPPRQERRFSASNKVVAFDHATSEALKALARRADITLFGALLALYKVTLSRWTDETDLTVGTPNAARDDPALEHMIGFTTSLFALRTSLEGDPTILEVLRRVRETTVDAFSHQKVPFGRLMAALQPSRRGSPRGYSLFPVFFSFQSIAFPNSPVAQLDLRELSNLPRFTVPHPTTKADLYLYLREIDGRVIGGFEYDTEVFADETVQRLILWFKRAAAAAIADPGRRLSALPLVEPEEERAMLAAVSPRPSRRRTSLSGPLIERARVCPEAVALLDEAGSLTYRDLVEQTGALARRLVEAGVRLETPVAIFMDRSVAALVAMLAVLRAGGTCVPIDTTWPEARVSSILGSSRARLVLTSSSERAWLPPALDAPIMQIDSQTDPRAAGEVAGAELPVALPDVPPEAAAFVFFTSGSTGTPSGVVVTHGSAGAGQHPDVADFALDGSDELLLTSPLSSARLLGELFWPLFAGARVRVATAAGHQDTEYLARVLDAGAVTVVSLVPAALATMLREDRLRPWRLRYLFLVGEALSADLAREVCERLGPNRPRIINAYAQTEACPVTFADDQPAGGATDIGRAATGVQVYVLDAAMRPVPPGIVGEIHVGGDVVARGYLGGARLTAARFVPDPFSGGGGDRLYATGDRARRREDGRLVYVGRADARVKLRGYRIDLSEVEAVIGREDAVAECAVVLRAVDGEPALAAFVVPRASDLDLPSLRLRLKRTLPLFMIPARLVSLPSLPRTRSGKVDRPALAAWALEERERGPASTPPRTATEVIIADVWRSVLNLPRVDANDNFFDLGGSSLGALKVVGQLGRQHRIAVTPREIIFGTLAELAAAADARAERG
jgi:amino acid adenylation domain-containing protein